MFPYNHIAIRRAQTDSSDVIILLSDVNVQIGCVETDTLRANLDNLRVYLERTDYLGILCEFYAGIGIKLVLIMKSLHIDVVLTYYFEY